LNLDSVAAGYVNLMLSFRGSERQPPNVLQLALRLSNAMETRSKEGVHAKELSPEERLVRCVKELHDVDGYLQKWQLDSDKQAAILNLIVGTTQGSRMLIERHLHRFKWASSAFTSDLLKRNRWLLNASPKCKAEFKAMLTVSPTSQELFLQLVIGQFYQKSKKVRANQRARCRLSGSQWDSWVNFACVYTLVLKEASLLETTVDLAAIKKAFMDLLLACKLKMSID